MFASRRVGGVRVSCLAIMIVAVIMIFAYGFFVRRLGIPDVLERKVIDDPSVHEFDGWAATHLLFWAFLGFWFPGRYLQALGVSLLWEGFEDFMGRHPLRVGGKRLQLIGATDGEGNFGDAAGDGGADSYWYGRYVTDTSFNLMGYIVGSALARRFWPEED